MYRRLICFFLMAILMIMPPIEPPPAEAQAGAESPIVLNLENAPLREALRLISRQSGLNLAFADDLVDGVTVSVILETSDVSQALRQVLRGTNLSYRRITDNQVVIISRTQTSVVEGVVVDGETGAPIEGASVFLANTTVGGQTDAEGAYRITGVPPGGYELVVRHIGYELVKAPFQIITPGTFRYDSKLTRRILTLTPTEVVGVGETMVRIGSEKWRRSLERFEALFIGRSFNGKRCKLMNPEVLTFYENKASETFRATADSLLHIENRAFGYRLHIVLNTFQSIGEEEFVEYSIVPQFEVMPPRTRQMALDWARNRRRSYEGSMKHFFSSLAQGRIEEDKFRLWPLNDISAFFEQKPVVDRLNPTTAIIQRSLRGGGVVRSNSPHFQEQAAHYEWIMKEPDDALAGQIIANDATGLFRMTFADYLGVEYGFTRSVIKLNKNVTLIDELGHDYIPFAITKYGIWSTKAVGDLLPADYVPE